MDFSFPRRFVTWTFHSLDVSFHGQLRCKVDTVGLSIIRPKPICEVNLKTKYRICITNDLALQYWVHFSL